MSLALPKRSRHAIRADSLASCLRISFGNCSLCLVSGDDACRVR
jgi:hypothetical protein